MAIGGMALSRRNLLGLLGALGVGSKDVLATVVDPKMGSNVNAMFANALGAVEDKDNSIDSILSTAVEEPKKLDVILKRLQQLKTGGAPTHLEYSWSRAAYRAVQEGHLPPNVAALKSVSRVHKSAMHFRQAYDEAKHDHLAEDLYYIARSKYNAETNDRWY